MKPWKPEEAQKRASGSQKARKPGQVQNRAPGRQRSSSSGHPDARGRGLKTRPRKPEEVQKRCPGSKRGFQKCRERRSRQSARQPEGVHSPEEASLQKRMPGYRSAGTTAVFSGASPHPCPWRSGGLLCGSTC